MGEGNIIRDLNAGLDPATVLADYYAGQSDAQVAAAYRAVAKGLAVFEETPRGSLGAALRVYLTVIATEQLKREGAPTNG